MTVQHTMHSCTPAEPTKLTGSARGRKAITARLARTDWTEMARPAFEAEGHVGRLDRWRRQARESNPALDDEQIDRLAEMLRREHFAELGRRGGASKRAAREAAARAADTE